MRRFHTVTCLEPLQPSQVAAVVERQLWDAKTRRTGKGREGVTPSVSQSS
jgi:hypothetical protein